MALQRIPGCNNQWLHGPVPLSSPALAAVLLDAAADRLTMIGQFVHQDQVSKTVDGLEFLFGSVSKANGSTMQVSLQHVDTATGPVIREDGTPDQIVSIANADANFTSNTWYGADFESGATRSLAIGELVAVVFQFGTFVAGDSVNIQGLSLGGGNVYDNRSCVVANLTGTYATQSLLANIVLRCSDGTFGTLENAWPTTAINTHTVNVGTAGADEYALGLQMPFPAGSNAIWIVAALAGSAFATECVLYNGTTILEAVSIDHNALGVATVRRLQVSYPQQTHVANILYRASIRPTGTTNISFYSSDVNEAGHLSCLPGGTNCGLWTRLDQGAWGGHLPTRRLLAGIRLNAFDDGAAGLLVGGRLVA